MVHTYYYCPRCNHRLLWCGYASDRMMDIVPPVVHCPSCKTAINTGGQEWADMSLSEKRKHQWGTLMIPLYSFPCVAVLGFVVYSETSSPIIASIAGVVPSVLFTMWGHLVLRSKIRQSLKRKPHASDAGVK
jgi:predicted nucleic acid-binding Zn ribbon protein